ncbi:MAG: single-stranded DNA-binding protein [Patescibacteria group bacterium]
MMSLNRAQIIGNMTRDPELRTTPAGTSVCSFGIATNRAFTDAQGQKQEQVEFHNIVAWAKLAEICGQYLAKGRRVFVEGRLQTREWTGQDGIKRRSTEIVAEDMIMLDRAPGGAGGAAPAGIAPRPAAVQQGAAQSGSPEELPTVSYDSPTTPGVTEEEIKVEDIPF